MLRPTRELHFLTSPIKPLVLWRKQGTEAVRANVAIYISKFRRIRSVECFLYTLGTLYKIGLIVPCRRTRVDYNLAFKKRQSFRLRRTFLILPPILDILVAYTPFPEGWDCATKRVALYSEVPGRSGRSESAKTDSYGFSQLKNLLAKYISNSEHWGCSQRFSDGLGMSSNVGIVVLFDYMTLHQGNIECSIVTAFCRDKRHQSMFSALSERVWASVATQRGPW